MTKNSDDLSEITRQTISQMSPDGWEKMRSVSFASAGVASALLLFILQANDLRQGAGWVVLLCCLAIPCLLASGFMTESYTTHGESSYKNMDRPLAFWLMSGIFYFGGAALIGAMFLLVHRFYPAQAYVFLALSIMAVPIVAWHFNTTKPGA